jgi:uncharacterized protein (TIGR02246 family)
MSESSMMNFKWTLAAMALGLAVIGGTDAAAQAPKKAAADPSARAADEKAIREAGAAFVRAYDAGDTRAIVQLFTVDAEVVSEDGEPIQGQEAIAALFASTFAANPGEKIELDEISIRFLGSDAAKEDGRARIVPAVANAGAPSRTAGQSVAHADLPQISRYTVLYVRQDGRWLQSSVREHAQMAITPHERLQPLAWLVGEWVDEGSSSVIHSNTQWSVDGNFLLRDFTIQIAGKPALHGTQRIGWDPLTRQIKSWVFDSEGGHGVALWAHDSDRWVVKGSGVLRDGRTATATQVYTIVNTHLVRWKSVDRTIGDKIEPDTAELVMVRKPPRPR